MSVELVSTKLMTSEQSRILKSTKLIGTMRENLTVTSPMILVRPRY